MSGGPRPREAPAPGGTIQREFTNAEPGHIVVGNGATRFAPGRAERPTVTLRFRLGD